MKRNILSLTSIVLCALLLLSPDMAAQARRSNTNNRSTSNRSTANRNTTGRNTSRGSSSQKWAKNKLDLYQIHNFSMWGGAGYSGLVNSYNNDNASKFIGGGGGLIGVGYEWHYKKFMLTLGPEFRIFSSQDNINFKAGDNPYSIGNIDPTNPAVLPGQTKYYDFQSMRETQAVGQIMLPILLGAQFNDLSVPIYFLAGAKVGYTLLHNFTQRADLKTTLHEPWAYDPSWYDVRDLGTTSYKATGKNDMGLDVALSAEIGVNLNPFFGEEWNANNEERKHPWHLRAALFVDYGLPLTELGTPAKMVAVDESTAKSISLHQSDYATSKLNSLLVGAKFTAVLQLTKPKQMKPQNPYLVLQLINGRTGKAMTGNDARANVEITNLKNGRVMKRVTNGKGMIIQRSAPGNYQVAVQKDGFLPYQPFEHELITGENNNLKQKIDTTKVILYPEPVFTFTVKNEKDGSSVHAHISIIDTLTGSTVMKSEALRGSGSMKLPVGDSYYSAMVEAKDYKTRIFAIGTQGLDDIHRDFLLEKIIRKRTFIIRNLFFASDQTDILPESEPALQELFEFLNSNPDIRVRLTGHTDWIGTDQANQILSEGRAASVKRSMVERGIDADRIETLGLGESQPIDTNETEAGRQNNRRVECTIISGELSETSKLAE